MFGAAELEMVSHLNPLNLKSQILDMELQDVVFTLLGFGLSLTQCFLIMSPLLPFEVKIYILCCCMLKTYHLILIFLQEVTN